MSAAILPQPFHGQDSVKGGGGYSQPPDMYIQLSLFGKTSWERFLQTTGWILEPSYPPQPFHGQDSVKGGGGYSQPPGHRDVVLHVLVHVPAADHKHMGAPSDRSGAWEVFREGDHPEGNEGPDHQTSGRLEGPAEGNGEAGEKEGPAGEVGAAR